MQVATAESGWLAHPVTLACTILGGVLTCLFVLFRAVLFNGGKFPGVPGGNWFFGHTLHFADPTKFMDIVEDWCEKYGTSEFRMMNQRFVIVADWEEVEKLNKLRPSKVQRFYLISDILDFAFPGLFAAEAPEWGVERRIISPAFAHRNLSTYVPTFRKIGARLHTVLREDGDKGAVAIDAYRTLQHFTLDIISNLGFGHDPDIVTKRTDEALTVSKLLEILAMRFPSPVPYWNIPFIGQYLDGGGFLRDRMNGFMTNVIAGAKAKRANGGPTTTILDKLIDGSENEGGVIPDRRLAGNVNTLFIAGSDTTSIAMTWMLYDLARDPQLQADARAEALAAGIDDASTFEEVLARLPLLRSLFQEELRLRAPSGPSVNGNRYVPVEVAGRICEPGEYIFIWPVHWFSKRPGVCPDPEKLIARRWLTEDGKSVNPMPAQVAPFGGSARICPGRDLVVVEALVCVSEILKAFAVDMRDPKEIGLTSKFSTQPAEPVMLNFHPL